MKNCFDQYANEYDNWYDLNKDVYDLEIEAIKKFLPPMEKTIEIGAGTGRFSSDLGINYSIEPSFNMGLLAKSKGIKVIQAKGESLPFRNREFDAILIVTVLCFVRDIPIFLCELNRVLKEDGSLIIAVIDKNSPLGKIYEKKKNNHRFYQYAKFYDTNEVLLFLDKAGFKATDFVQTVFENQEKIVKKGFGEGVFVVINAKKK